MFIVKGIDISDTEAKRLFDEAETYLRRSDMAGFVLDNLAGLREPIRICIGKKGSIVNLAKFMSPKIPDSYVAMVKRLNWEIENVYIFPKDGDPLLYGGTIMWNPAMTLPVIDKAKHRPDHPWIEQHRGPSHLFGLIKGKKQDKRGVISPQVALAHEMGHAMQFFTCRQGLFRGQDASSYKKHVEKEDDNVASIEHTIVLELNTAGADEGIRWGYYDTA